VTAGSSFPSCKLGDYPPAPDTIDYCTKYVFLGTVTVTPPPVTPPSPLLPTVPTFVWIIVAVVLVAGIVLGLVVWLVCRKKEEEHV